MRDEYPELFAAIGTMYGTGDGSSTFNVPNLQNNNVVNYIIATGKNTGVNVTDIIAGAQALPLGVEYGGTGATNAATARANLGITPENIGAMSMDLLWENDSPTSEFAAGNIPNLPFDLYDEYALMTMASTTYQYVLYSQAPRGKNIAVSFDWADDGVYHSRVFKVNGNSLDVMRGWTSKASDSSAIIPYRIYGIKGVS